MALDVSDVRGRAFAAPATKPRLLLAPLAVKDNRWREASIYWATVDPALPEQLQQTLEKSARGTSLFSDVVRVSWGAEQLGAKRAECKPDDLLLVPEMAVCNVDGGPTAAAYAFGILTLGVMPLLSLMGIPTLKFEQESEWRLRYRLLDVATGETRILWDSDPIITNDAGFVASWSNTPTHLRGMLERQGRRLSSSFTASFAPLAAEGKPLDVEYPYEAVSPRVDIRVNVAEDPSLTFIDVDVNDQHVLRRDRTVEPHTTFPVTIELNKGTNVINIVARDKSGNPLSRIDITITRHR